MLLQGEWTLVLIVFTVNDAALSEDCKQFKEKENVTIDTDQYLWQTYPESKPRRFCLESCFNNDKVKTVTF